MSLDTPSEGQIRRLSASGLFGEMDNKRTTTLLDLSHQEIRGEICREITSHHRDDQKLLLKLQLIREIQYQLGLGTIQEELKKEEQEANS